MLCPRSQSHVTGKADLAQKEQQSHVLRAHVVHDQRGPIY